MTGRRGVYRVRVIGCVVLVARVTNRRIGREVCHDVAHPGSVRPDGRIQRRTVCLVLILPGKHRPHADIAHRPARRDSGIDVRLKERPRRRAGGRVEKDVIRSGEDHEVIIRRIYSRRVYPRHRVRRQRPEAVRRRDGINVIQALPADPIIRLNGPGRARMDTVEAFRD